MLRGASFARSFIHSWLRRWSLKSNFAIFQQYVRPQYLPLCFMWGSDQIFMIPHDERTKKICWKNILLNSFDSIHIRIYILIWLIPILSQSWMEKEKNEMLSLWFTLDWTKWKGRLMCLRKFFSIAAKFNWHDVYLFSVF